MEYERIDKVQTGIISPSKLRMKFMGPHHHRKTDGSNSHSSRTSPSKIQDTEFVKDSLLASGNEDLEDAVTTPNLEVLSSKPCSDLAVHNSQQISQNSCKQQETFTQQNGDSACNKMQYFPKGESGNSSTIHPARATEDEDLGYDSNASSSSFEFHKRDRSSNNHAARSLSRPIPYKWNDAEKWIMNMKNVPNGYTKKNGVQNQTNRQALAHIARVAPESTNYDNKSMPVKAAETKRVDFCQKSLQNGVERFSFIPSGPQTSSTHSNGPHPLVNFFPQCKDLAEVNHRDLSCIERSDEAVPGVRSVSMRDMGTEMTPATSQEPSQTATPVGSTTPLRSPNSSIPSTPRRGIPATPQMDLTQGAESQPLPETDKKQLSEEEIKQNTRKEIAALGVQLGKMNIAAWASKSEQEKIKSASEAKSLELERIEFEKRAAAWEEAEKSKHTARYKREEIKIQAWESQKKAKLEAEMRRIEAHVEQTRAQAQAKTVKRIAMARQKSEEKRAAAEARRNQDAERATAQAEYIRQTGRMPSSRFMCCGWL